MHAEPSEATQRLQRRTLAVLGAAQVFGGIGVASGIAVGALLLVDLGRESLSGLASSSSVIGAAFTAVPVARYMSTHGRRKGLLLAYLVGTVGVLLVVAGAVLRFFPLALVGLVLAGSSTAAGLQSRYAAVDLATASTRGRSLATVVWATTVGSVLGPNLAEPMGRLAASIGMPPLAGPFMLSSVAFVVAATIIGLLLRPDPLFAAREIAGAPPAGGTGVSPRPSVRTVLTGIGAVPSALLGLAAMAVGHAVMVGVMSMTPVHLQHGGASLRIVGLVISLHIAGMYIASPLVGWLADRFGRHHVILAGGAILLAAFVLAGTATGHESTQLAVGLFLLGLGWSCTLIAGSTLLTESVPAEERPGVQGTSDLVMGIAGGSAGLLSGIVVATASYGLLNVIATVLVAPLIVFALRDAMRRARLVEPVEVGAAERRMEGDAR